MSAHTKRAELERKLRALGLERKGGGAKNAYWGLGSKKGERGVLKIAASKPGVFVRMGPRYVNVVERHHPHRYYMGRLSYSTILEPLEDIPVTNGVYYGQIGKGLEDRLLEVLERHRGRTVLLQQITQMFRQLFAQVRDGTCDHSLLGDYLIATMQAETTNCRRELARLQDIVNQRKKVLDLEPVDLIQLLEDVRSKSCLPPLRYSEAVKRGPPSGRADLERLAELREAIGAATGAVPDGFDEFEDALEQADTDTLERWADLVGSPVPPDWAEDADFHMQGGFHAYLQAWLHDVVDRLLYNANFGVR